MKYVENKIFYHLDTKNHFLPGNNYTIGNELNPFYSFYESCTPNPIDINTNTNSLMFEMMKYIRERIYEDIRLEVNPKLPSRLKCIWLIPGDHLINRLNYWSPQVGCRKLVKLLCTGNMHSVDQRFLVTRPFGFAIQRYLAKKYWEGEFVDKKNKIQNEEILFTGQIHVLDIKSFNP